MKAIVRFTDQRLENQQISRTSFKQPDHVVHHMVAIQAQDFYSSLWAIGLRTAATTTEADIEQAITDKKIVRTWPMRGTLHFVAAEDARWMLDLLAPRVIKSSASRHRELELDKTSFAKSRKLIEKVLKRGKQFTRSELYRILEEGGITTEGQRGYHILWYLAQKAVICFGPRRNKRHTFVLFDEWIPHSKDLSGNEALAELAFRYIKSRGPVTEYDFAYWSGLKVTTARKAIHLVEKDFEKKDVAGQTYWFPKPGSETVSEAKKPYLLPAFDELICGYRDRSTVLNSEHEKSTILRNGIIRPVIVADGSVVGTWKRTLEKKKVAIETELFRKINKVEKKALVTAGQQYGDFLGLQAKFEDGF